MVGGPIAVTLGRSNMIEPGPGTSDWCDRSESVDLTHLVYAYLPTSI